MMSARVVPVPAMPRAIAAVVALAFKGIGAAVPIARLSWCSSLPSVFLQIIFGSLGIVVVCSMPGTRTSSPTVAVGIFWI